MYVYEVTKKKEEHLHWLYMSLPNMKLWHLHWIKMALSIVVSCQL